MTAIGDVAFGIDEWLVISWCSSGYSRGSNRGPTRGPEGEDEGVIVTSKEGLGSHVFGHKQPGTNTINLFHCYYQYLEWKLPRPISSY